MAPVGPIPEGQEPARVPRSWGLGALLENSLVRFVVQAFNRLRESVAETFRYGVESTLESLEWPLLDLVGPVLDDLLAIPELPDSLRNIISRMRAGTHPAPVIGLAVLLPLLVLPVANALFSGLFTIVSYGSNRLFKPFRLDFGTWFLANKRSPVLDADMRRELAGQGWSEQQIEVATLVSERWPDASELMTLWRRGDIDDLGFGVRIQALGVNAEGVEMFRKLKDLIPGPGDLVRFALREAWRDDVAAKWGYDQARVPEFDEWMEKQGYSTEWSRAFWRAHWVVPSVGQGFEMLHRGEINDDEMVDLLKINDLAPGWVGPLMAIARPVPGRIDRRWAYEEGEINEQELFDLYKSDGYDDFWAGVLTSTVIKRAVSEVKGLTRAAVERAYRKRRLSRQEAVTMLVDLGIQLAIADFYLEQVDQDRSEELLDRRADAVEKGYLAGLLAEGDVYERLGVLGIATEEIEADLEIWNIVLGTRTKRPSRANLDKWFRQGTIGVPEYRRHMSLLQYSGAYVDMYLASLAVERVELAEKEERAAREEQERVRTARYRSDYQRDKAGVDKDIAELNAAIADAQVALVSAQGEREERLRHVMSVAEIAALEREYKALFREADVAVETARLRVAALRVSVQENEVQQSEIKRALAANRDVVLHERLSTERLALDTQLAGFTRAIAGRRTTVAEIRERVFLVEDPEVAIEMRQRVLELQREIAEYQELQAEMRERQEEIDEALRLTLSLEEKQAFQIQIAELAAAVSRVQGEIDALRETIRVVQVEKSELEQELQSSIDALPGRDEQIVIRSEYDALIDDIQSRIAVFRSNIAELRIAKSRLLVEYRSVD